MSIQESIQETGCKSAMNRASTQANNGRYKKKVFSQSEKNNNNGENV